MAAKIQEVVENLYELMVAHRERWRHHPKRC